MNRPHLPSITAFSGARLWKKSCLAAAVALTGTLQALAVLPPGATAAPACAGSTGYAFPKRLAACGPTFGAWDTAYAYPFYGRSGIFVNASVNGTSSSQQAYIELDQSGNTVRKIAPVQLDTSITPTEDANIFFAEQQTTNSTELSFGRFNAGTFAAVYQYKLTGVPTGSSVSPGTLDGRAIVCLPSATQIDVISINTNGTTAWAKRLTSASFGVNAGLGETQSAFTFPATDGTGAVYVEVMKTSFSFTPPNIGLTTEIYLIRLSSTGTVEWSKKFAGTSGNGVLIPSTTGSLYLALLDPLTSTLNLTKITTAGAVSWAKKFSGYFLYPSFSELPGEKLLINGFSGSAFGESVLAVLNSSGNIEAQTKFSIGTFNLTTPVIEGTRIWLSTIVPSNSQNPYASPSPTYVGYTDTALGAIQWRKYTRNATHVLVSPDTETDDVLCSFSNLAERSLELVTIKDNLTVNASCELFTTPAAIAQTDPNITVATGAVTVTDFTASVANFTPTLATATLTFETQGLSETSLCGGGASLTPPTITGNPTNLTATVGGSITLTASTSAPSPTWQWKFNGVNIAGATSAAYTLNNIQANQAGTYSVVLTSAGQSAETSTTVTVNAAAAITFTAQPLPLVIAAGANAVFSGAISNPGALAVTYQWFFNGTAIPGATTSNYSVASVQAANIGYYTLSATAGGNTIVSNPALLSLNLVGARFQGATSEVGFNIVHPNGNVYDQYLLNGASAAITADAGQVSRLSYIDSTGDDIVQVEFSGPGVLTISLANVSGPAAPTKYNQPAAQYMRGHATLVVTGATENTHVSVLSVGKLTAFDPTGAYDVSKPVSGTNNPANNGNPIFKAGETYDGVADIASLSIASATNRVGGIRFANTEFSGATGTVGLYAPGVRSAGPVNIHNVSASGTATPYLLTGTIDAFGANPAGRIGITGGDMLQPNAKVVVFGDATIVGMLAGATSHNTPQPAQTNKGVYERNGVNVTGTVVQGP